MAGAKIPLAARSENMLGIIYPPITDWTPHPPGILPGGFFVCASADMTTKRRLGPAPGTFMPVNVWKKGQSGNPAGPKSIYTPELAAEFCHRIAGGRSFKDVCSDEDMPGERTVREWRQARPEFDAAVRLAFDDRLEATRHKLMEIAEAVLRPDGPPADRANAAAHAISKAETMSRSKIEITGRNGGPIETKDVSDLDAARAVAFLLASAARSAPGS